MRERILNSNVFWEFDKSSGLLNISGSGEMPWMIKVVSTGHKKAETTYEMPWRDFRDQIQSVIFSDGVSTVSAISFWGCTNLKEVILPSVISISPSAFYECHSLTEVVAPRVVSIGNSAFSRCFSLKRIVPEKDNLQKWKLDSLLFIDDFGFSDCKSLEKIVFNNLKAIGEGAFIGCKSLKSISTERLYMISSLAFSACESIETMRVREGCSISSDAFFNTNIQEPTSFIEKQSGAE